MPPEEQDGGSGDRRSAMRAFWTSLPGLLTGVAALITAVVTALAAVHIGDGGDGAAVRSASSAAAGHGTGCLQRFLHGIAAERVAPVEAGTTDLEVIAADQPKAGQIGLRFTKDGIEIGAMRLKYFPGDALFKIDSVVDDRCAPVTEYSNVTRGGDRNSLASADTVRLRLGERQYDLRIEGGTTVIVDGFVAFTP